jgi:mutator protein MutT
MSDKAPKVGVGVMILNDDGEVLLAKRRGSHGEGEYAFPGGHLEFGELFSDCAERETKEEAGIVISNIRFQYLANILKYGGKHYVHIGLIADYAGGEPQVLEPEKAKAGDGIQWMPHHNLYLKCVDLLLKVTNLDKIILTFQNSYNSGTYTVPNKTTHQK